MSERKLRDGYYRVRLHALQNGILHIPITVICKTRSDDNGTDWWPENPASSECFEPDEPELTIANQHRWFSGYSCKKCGRSYTAAENNRPCPGHGPAEPERPKPISQKFAKGHKVKMTPEQLHDDIYTVESAWFGKASSIAPEDWQYALESQNGRLGYASESMLESADTESPKPKFIRGTCILTPCGTVVICRVDWHTEGWRYQCVGANGSLSVFTEHELLAFGTENPTPKFEVGQWVSDIGHSARTMIYPTGVIEQVFPDMFGLGKHGVMVGGQWAHEWELEPCSPVCTEAQLAIRVGDEVRVKHSWRPDGIPNQPPYSSEKVWTVDRIYRLSPSGNIQVMFSMMDGTWLWNLEPVKPRA